jgi:hypothetical protein
MPNFHIEGRMKGASDILRNYNFELLIPDISNIVTTITNDEPLIIRAKTAAIPDRSNTPIESYFAGMVQYFPGRVTFGSTLNVEFEEGEDLTITKTLYEWQNRIFNINENDEDTGHALAESKRNGQTTNIYVKMFKYNGQAVDNMIKCVNAWPTSISESPLDMRGSEAIFRSVVFQFDYWDLVKV